MRVAVSILGGSTLFIISLCAMFAALTMFDRLSFSSKLPLSKTNLALSVAYAVIIAAVWVVACY
jgi:hypothetical protein